MTSIGPATGADRVFLASRVHRTLLRSGSPLWRPDLALREVHPVRERPAGRVIDVRKTLRRPPDVHRHDGEGFQSCAALYPVGDAITRLHVPVSRQKHYPPARALEIPEMFAKTGRSAGTGGGITPSSGRVTQKTGKTEKGLGWRGKQCWLKQDSGR